MFQTVFMFVVAEAAALVAGSSAFVIIIFFHPFSNGIFAYCECGIFKRRRIIFILFINAFQTVFKFQPFGAFELCLRRIKQVLID